MLNKLKSLSRVQVIMLVVAVLTLGATSAFAFTAPQATDILYPVYDIIVNKLIEKGITYLVGFIGLCVAAYFLMQQKIMPGLFCIIGGIIFLSASAITTAFGLLY